MCFSYSTSESESFCSLVCGVFSSSVAADYPGRPQDVDKWVGALCVLQIE